MSAIERTLKEFFYEHCTFVLKSLRLSLNQRDIEIEQHSINISKLFPMNSKKWPIIILTNDRFYSAL